MELRRRDIEATWNHQVYVSRDEPTTMYSGYIKGMCMSQAEQAYHEGLFFDDTGVNPLRYWDKGMSELLGKDIHLSPGQQAVLTIEVKMVVKDKNGNYVKINK